LFFFCDPAGGAARVSLFLACSEVWSGETGVSETVTEFDSDALDCSVAAGGADATWPAEYWALLSNPVNEMVIAIAIRARFNGMNKTSCFGLVTQVSAWFCFVPRPDLASVVPS
jgi:hypothetical protein